MKTNDNTAGEPNPVQQPTPESVVENQGHHVEEGAHANLGDDLPPINPEEVDDPDPPAPAVLKSAAVTKAVNSSPETTVHKDALLTSTAPNRKIPASSYVRAGRSHVDQANRRNSLHRIPQGFDSNER
ncbi:MAG: hypothetical protein KJ072_18425 [Verrucomicrobia bacterium]|nr:hypothetical protein [Verrucomicrobiota bacterium]